MEAGSAWALAGGAAERAGVTLEPLESFGDVVDACSVIGAVWGEDAAQVHYIRAIQHAGNVFYGSRAGGRMVGFVLGLLGSSEGSEAGESDGEGRARRHRGPNRQHRHADRGVQQAAGRSPNVIVR